MYTKTRKAIYALILCMVMALCLVFGFTGLSSRGVSAADGLTEGTFAQTGLTVHKGTATLSGVSTDPVSYRDEASGGALVSATEALDTAKLASADPIIFTALYPYTTTKRTGEFKEYTVEYVDKTYKVTKVNATGDGTTYIPVGGYVLSLPASSSFAVEVGDTLTVDNLKLVERAVESDEGARVAIDTLNGVRTGYMVVYYDYDFGEKTGTNIFGTELIAVFDETSGKFNLTSFRGFGMGDDSGSVIPDNGFVLSAHGETGFRGRLLEGNRFNLGDKLSLVGFDYIRFGGEPVRYTYDYIYQNANDWEVNPNVWESENEPFAAYRGPDQMIIYKDGWKYNDAKGTGTNVYGYEAAVDANGDVVERGVNVSAIPAGGYVISGHGLARDFIRSQIPKGAKITMNEGKKEIAVTTSLNSFFVNTQETVLGIVQSAQKMVDQLYDVDRTGLTAKIAEANNRLTALEATKTEIETQMEQGTWSDLDKTKALMSYNAQKLEVEALGYEILSMSSESRPVTARAVWHRPVEKNLSDLQATINAYADTGINLIFVETFFNGYSMFKSEYVDYHKDFVSANYLGYEDYLSAFVALAKAKGIEVHAWVEDFYVGLSKNIKLLNQHEDWIMYNYDGTYLQKNEGGEYIFIDPVNPAVQDFLITYYTELLTKFPDVAGLNLDYIRYPVSTKAEDTGYTMYAMTEFAKTVGKESTLTATSVDKMITQFRRNVLNSTANYNAWCEFRMKAVTGFVERVNNEIKKEKDILLSTAVFSSITQTKEQKKQDWQTWFRNGWIDIATPMAYFDAAEEVMGGVSQMIVAAGTKCYYYTGLASSYRGMAAYENCYQIEASYMGGASGYVIFCSTQVIGHNDVQTLLKAGVNSKEAVLPHASADKILEAYFNRVLDRAERIYVPNGGMTAEQKTALAARFDSILAMPCETGADLVAIQEEVAKLTKQAGTQSFAKGFSGTRIREAMSELYNLLETKISILGYQAPAPSTPTTPSTPSNPSTTPSASDSVEEESGCGSVIGGISAGISVLMVSAYVLTKKKEQLK